MGHGILGMLMRWLLLLVVLFASGCGQGYVMPQAATRVEFASVADFDAAFATIRAHILRQGFEQAPDDPVPDFMLEHSSAGMRWRQIHAKHFWRERGGLLDHESAFVELTPYPDTSPEYQAYSDYSDAQPHWPFLEIHVSEARPDGFSTGTLQFYADLVQSLSTPNATVVNLVSAKAGSAEAYANYVRSGLMLTIAWWLVTWSVSITVIGGIATWLFGFFDWSRRVRRFAFVAVGGLLATPLPVPTMLMTLLLPNALLFWTPGPYAELLAQSGLVVAAMFAASSALSALAAMIFFRRRKSRTDATSQKTA